MPHLDRARELVCRSLINRISVFDSLLRESVDTAERIKLYKMQTQFLSRLEMMCR